MAMPRVNVRLDDELYDRLAKAAQRRGCRISRLVRDVLASGLDDNRASAVGAGATGTDARHPRFVSFPSAARASPFIFRATFCR